MSELVCLVQSTWNKYPEKSMNEMTAWRLGPRIHNERLIKFNQKTMISFRALIIRREIQIIRYNIYPRFIEICKHELDGPKKTLFKLDYQNLTKKEKNGTPSGICIRKYFN
jgi:hypothetical protein